MVPTQLYERVLGMIKTCNSCKKRYLFTSSKDLPNYKGESSGFHWFNCECKSTLVILVEEFDE